MSVNYNPPFMYPEVNLIQSSFQDMSEFYDSEVYWFWWRNLYEMLLSEFDVECEDTWNKGLLMYCILGNGYIGVFDTDIDANSPKDMYGILPLPATLTGVNIQYLPFKATAVAPHSSGIILGIKDKIIYKDCGLITISPNYKGGVFHIIDHYARKLALLSSSLDQAIINARDFYAMYANNEQGAATLNAMMEARLSGKPFAVIDKKILTKEMKKEDVLGDKIEPISFVDFNVGANYITDKIIMDIASIINEYCRRVGIANNPAQDKKERLIQTEVESNSAETVAQFTVWLNYLTDSIRKTKEVFPDLKLNITRHVYDTGNTGSREAGKEVKVNAMENDS